jgi:glycine cleavage system H protein
MAIVRGCDFPEALLYDIAHHVWYVPAGDGLVRAGITPVGVALAREVLIFTPKRVGRSFEKGRAIATVESAKWVGSVRSAFAGRVKAVNEALVAKATPVNGDCYGAGWMMLLRPAGPEWSAGLVTGTAIGPAYADWMEREGFEGCAKLPD